MTVEPMQPLDVESDAPARRWTMRLVLAAALAATFLIDRGAFVVVPLLFVLVVPFEKLFPRHRGQRLRRPLAWLDIRYALLNPLLSAVGIAAAIVIGLISLAWLPGLLLRPVVAMLPGWLSLVLAVGAFDMLGYWGHRWMHEIPQLWRFHSVHHSTEHLDWVSGFRLHPLDGIVIAPPAAFLLAAGIEPEVVGVLAVVQIVIGIFLHANVRWRLRPLHLIVATPEFHHWHHANETDAHCSNYSGLFPIWDTVFGTYRMPRNLRPVRYGVHDPVPMTMAGQLRYPVADAPPLRTIVRHPVHTSKRAVRGARSIARGAIHSARRPRRRRLRPGDPYPWTSRSPGVTREPADR